MAKKIYYFSPNLNTPSGGIGVLLKQATLLQEANYEVHIMYHPRPLGTETNGLMIYEEFKPEWLEFAFDKLKFLPIGQGTVRTDRNNLLQCTHVGFTKNDLLILPEEASPLLEITLAQNLPCKRVVLAQSWIGMLVNLAAGKKWQDFGITEVITVSDAITDFLNKYMPGLTIHQYSPSIPQNLFTPPPPHQEKVLGICFMASRGLEQQVKVKTALRIFQLRYPQYKNIPVVELKDMTRAQFARTLAKYSVALFTDEVAGWGTLPLEAMACHTHVVGFRTYGGQEYMTADNGFWVPCGNVFALGEKLGEVIDKLYKKELDEEKLFENYQRTLDRYTEEKEKQRVLEIVKKILG
jgi:hypothetical protein